MHAGQLSSNCAADQGWVSIFTVAESSFNHITPHLENKITNFCAGADVGETAVSITAAFASAVAKVYDAWARYVCLAPQKGCGTSTEAELLVREDGLAVAEAVAFSIAQAMNKLRAAASSNTCVTGLASRFISATFIADTRLAVLKVPNAIAKNPPATCSAADVQELTRCNFASAFACPVAKVLTSVSSDPTPDSGSCSDTLVLSGIRTNAVLVCPSSCYSSASITPSCNAEASGSITCSGKFYGATDTAFATPLDPTCSAV